MEAKRESANLTKSILRTSSLYSSSLRVTFDEETIKEHDKMRGSKMKIDEPKTPFHYFDEEGNEILPPKSEKRSSVDLVALNKKFEQEKSQLGISDSDEEPIEIDEKRKKFLEKRKSHYSNEYCGGNPLHKKPKDNDPEDEGGDES